MTRSISEHLFLVNAELWRRGVMTARENRRHEPPVLRKNAGRRPPYDVAIPSFENSSTTLSS
jgi:hypothetical protein